LVPHHHQVKPVLQVDQVSDNKIQKYQRSRPNLVKQVSWKNKKVKRSRPNLFCWKLKMSHWPKVKVKRAFHIGIWIWKIGLEKVCGKDRKPGSKDKVKLNLQANHVPWKRRKGQACSSDR
jgi:hypothetical protein